MPMRPQGCWECCRTHVLCGSSRRESEGLQKQSGRSLQAWAGQKDPGCRRERRRSNQSGCPPEAAVAVPCSQQEGNARVRTQHPASGRRDPAGLPIQLSASVCRSNLNDLTDADAPRCNALAPKEGVRFSLQMPLAQVRRCKQFDGYELQSAARPFI